MNTQKWAFVGDLQIPYHDPRAIALWFKVMKWWKPQIIDIVGDIDDCLEFSTFSDGTTDEFFNKIKKSAEESPVPYVMEMTKAARDFYTDVRTAHPDADIFAALGNHELRIPRYIDKKAPEYLDDLTYSKVYSLDNLGIKYIDYDAKPVLRHADIYVHHGTSTSSSSLAVGKDIENLGVSLVRGHSHQAGVVFKTYPMLNKTLQGMETGHMCNPDAYGLKYAANPSWELGFGIAHIVNGYAHLQFIPITPDYQCVVDGKVFKG